MLQLLELGFEGYVSDCISYPEEIHNYVASQLRFHEIVRIFKFVYFLCGKTHQWDLKPITIEEHQGIWYSSAVEAVGYAGGEIYVYGDMIITIEKLYDGTPSIKDVYDYLEAKYLCT